MKKLNLFLLSFALLGVLFTGCEEEAALEPLLTITSTDHVADANNNVTIAWRVDAGDAKLATISIINTATAGPVAGWDEIDIPNDDPYIDQATINISQSATLRVTVTDNDGLTDSETVDIIVGDQGTPLTSFTQVILGAQLNTSNASCASLETGDTYSISGSVAAANSDEVDIVHYNGLRNVALYSPSNNDIQATSYGISEWDNINDTKLLLTNLTQSDFNDIATDDDLTDLGTPTADVVGSLQVGDVVLFETAGGKMGVFIVSGIVDSNNGSVTIDVKVKE